MLLSGDHLILFEFELRRVSHFQDVIPQLLVHRSMAAGQVVATPQFPYNYSYCIMCFNPGKNGPLGIPM